MTNKEAIDNLKNYIECLMEDYGYLKDIVEFRDSVEHLEKSLQTQQAEIKKKDKMIEYMANFINEKTPYTKDTRILENERGVRNTKYTEQYFEYKVEEDK